MATTAFSPARASWTRRASWGPSGIAVLWTGLWMRDERVRALLRPSR